MGRAASKSYFQDSSLHSADISTACWCLSFHLCTTLSCPIHQVKKPQPKTKQKKPPTCVFSNICFQSMAREGGSDFFSLVGIMQTWIPVPAQSGRDMLPGSGSLGSTLLGSTRARQPQYLPPVQLRTWACSRWAVKV